MNEIVFDVVCKCFYIAHSGVVSKSKNEAKKANILSMPLTIRLKCKKPRKTTKVVALAVKAQRMIQGQKQQKCHPKLPKISKKSPITQSQIAKSVSKTRIKITLLFLQKIFLKTPCSKQRIATRILWT